MIDFSTNVIFKLGNCDPADIAPAVEPLLIEGEKLLFAAKTIRDFVVFTDKRMIAVNVHGITGKKRDFTTLPYANIQTYSVQTAGLFDIDAELDLFFAGLGNAHLEFKGKFDILGLSRAIATFVLNKD